MTAKLISSLSGQLSKAFPVLTVLNFSAQMGALPRKQQFVGALASLGAASQGPNSILADDANRAIWGCHLDGGRAQYGLGDHKGGRQGGDTGVARNVGACVLVSCDHVGDNICCWNIGR